MCSLAPHHASAAAAKLHKIDYVAGALYAEHAMPDDRAPETRSTHLLDLFRAHRCKMIWVVVNQQELMTSFDPPSDLIKKLMINVWLCVLDDPVKRQNGRQPLSHGVGQDQSATMFQNGCVRDKVQFEFVYVINVAKIYHPPE